MRRPSGPADVSSVVNALGRHMQWSVTSRGSNLGPGESALYQRIISNNSYA